MATAIKRRPRRRKPPRIRWKLRRIPNGWQGYISVPVGLTRGGRRRVVNVKAKGKTKAGAIQNAAQGALAIANNPLLQAVLPPGTGTAVKAVGLLAKAAKSGQAGKLLGKLKGPGAKRLAKALKFW